MESHRVVQLEGPLTVPNADTILGSIVTALNAATTLTIDVSAATDFDISFLQILIAARKTAAQDGKAIAIAADGSATLSKQISRCGLSLAPTPAGVHALPCFTTGSNS